MSLMEYRCPESGCEFFCRVDPDTLYFMKIAHKAETGHPTLKGRLRRLYRSVAKALGGKQE